MYVKMTQLQHILKRPDTYVGSIESITQPMWVFDDASGMIKRRTISYVPGLYKIFDEILVNAADNKQRDASMDRLEVSIDPEANVISVCNNGKGIPISMHKEHKVYVPDLIFGHLLTSSNYDDDEKKVTGGRNGYGAKLANIFSTSFTVETVDSRQGLKYIQTFTDNMGSKTEPEITKVAKDKRGRGDYTRITFSPDLARFGMETLDDDVVALLKKRVHDMAGVTDASVKVYLNGTRIAATGFEKYVGLYVPDESAPRVFARINDRWEVCVSVSDGQFNQVSFVNAICTVKGGQHVDYIADQVTKEMVRLANRKNKGVQVKPHHVKNHLFVFVNALIENPAFDSQTKETLTTRSKAFGSTAELPPKFLKAVAAAGVVDRVLAWAKFKQTSELKRVGGSKKVNLSGIPKLNDANWAGGARSGQCTLILTEGDSAMTTAVSGLSVVGRDAYGVFPLKGKPLNVREATHASIMANTEISNIVKIMG
ncbi:TOP2, partial [Symbiodinium sp. KB8]